MADRRHAQRSRKCSLGVPAGFDGTTGTTGGTGARGDGGGSGGRKHEKNEPKSGNKISSDFDGQNGFHVKPQDDHPQGAVGVVTNASDLTLEQQLAVLDEATELPPFGFNIAGLEKRLQRRLGFEITQSAINGCLSPYYNLREWGDRYVVTTLGSEPEDFPGQGSGNHPPLSPLKEFYLLSSDDDDDDCYDEDDNEDNEIVRELSRIEAGGGGGRVADGKSGGRGRGGPRPCQHRRASSGGTSNSGRFGNDAMSDREGGYDEEGGSDTGDDAAEIDGMDDD